ncbi:MAG: hypothetical protein WC836_24005, partial [Desulfobacula sp.]
ASSNNQTATTTKILPSKGVPYTLTIEQMPFTLPSGIHSGVSGVFEGKWLFLAGRTNGLHHFDNNDDNFPPSSQNTTVYVVDPIAQTVVTRSLTDAQSGLTQHQIDLLSVTSPQSYQKDDTIYMTGGYGVDTNSGLFSTKDALTAIDIPGLMEWVLNPSSDLTAAASIRQIFNPVFKITGGFMTQIGSQPTMLVFGQNFQGFYHDESNGDYSQQIRRFNIYDDGQNLSVFVFDSKPSEQNPDYRRRDLNVVPSIKSVQGAPIQCLVAYSGVFTIPGGAWTVPVVISQNGNSFEKNANAPDAFKQGMNNYVCPTVGLYSQKKQRMLTSFLGGISYGFYSGGVFQTDEELPFINQVTTIQFDSKSRFSQYLMEGEYPVILSTGSNPGNQLLFGAGAFYMNADGLPMYPNQVIKFDSLKKKTATTVGYVVGGIMSTLPNTV